MARNKCLVLLGYEDEPIGLKDEPLLNHTVNKVGGIPNWPGSDLAIATCPLCGQNRPLILQIYAPLENSQFHRTLYVFACLNAPCSTQSASWLSVRIQALEKSPIDQDSAAGCQQLLKSPPQSISWCSGEDDWDEAELPCTGAGNFVRVDTATALEENGNTIQYDNAASRMSDEDDESNSYENDPVPGFGNMRVDERNANGATAAKVGIIDNLYTSMATAEIEGVQEDVIVAAEGLADTHHGQPKRDLVALLNQPQIIPKHVKDLTLKSFYISVDEEQISASPSCDIGGDHIQNLLMEYQKNEELKSPESPKGAAAVGGKGASNSVQLVEQEMYEKAMPLHGDVMFHNFMSRIKQNPGQILRYSRDATPLLIAPLKDVQQRQLICQHCGSETICEVQLLPTVIERLSLAASGERVPIDFGNVLIWTCAKSCWDTPDRMRTETVIVQQEG